MAKEGLQDSLDPYWAVSVYLHPPSINWSYYDHGLFVWSVKKKYFCNVLPVTQQGYKVQICKHIILFVIC